jgi:hypothetical protein
MAATDRDARPMAQARSITLAWALRAAVGVASVTFVAVYVVTAVRRCAYPFELEWMEGAMVDHVDRVLRGERLYVQPSLEFVPFIYGPVFFFVSAAVAKVTGIGFLPLRLVSMFASFGCFGLLYALVERETRDRVAGLVAVGAFAATYSRSAFFFDLGRVDSLGLFFGLAAIYVVRRRGDALAGQLAAAALLGLAFLTKQTMLLVAVAMLAWLVATERRRALPFALATSVTTFGAFFALDWMHQGWLRYYLWELPQSHPIVSTAWGGFWSEDLLPLGIGAAFAIYFLLGARQRSSALFFALAAGGLVAGSWSGRLHDGGWPNVLIPAFAAVALLFGLGFAEATARLEMEGGGARHALFVIAIAQLAALSYDAGRTLPRRNDRAMGEAMVERLRALPGDVWLPSHAWYGHLAGKRTFAHRMAIDDVLRGDPFGEAIPLRFAIRRAIESKRFAAVLVDDDFFEPDLKRRYSAAQVPFFSAEGFYEPNGIHIRPKTLYLRTP